MDYYLSTFEVCTSRYKKNILSATCIEHFRTIQAYVLLATIHVKHGSMFILAVIVRQINPNPDTFIKQPGQHSVLIHLLQVISIILPAGDKETAPEAVLKELLTRITFDTRSPQ